MNDRRYSWPLVLLASALAWAAYGQETVTIPKARLQELERKEQELERLQGAVTKATDENARLKTRLDQAATNTPVPPPPSKPIPPLDSLPPLKPADVVEAADLANYYRSNTTAADRRYRGQHFTVRGEIAGFEKPAMRRNYRILLQGGDRETKVIGDFYPPDKFNAVFTVEHGSRLVGLVGDTRVPLAKVGQRVLITGQGKGWREGAVMISAAELKLAP
jgi:hypothetical protein